MEASVVDLRYNMKNILKALDRNEDVKILYHGNVKGILKPKEEEIKMKVKDHPIFNMDRSGESVDDTMNKLRAGRYNDI